MTIASVIAVVGVLIAIYAIMPRARQLDLLLRLRGRDWLLLGAGILLVHYLLFYRQFSALGVFPRLDLDHWTLEPNEIAYIVLLLCVLIVGTDVLLFRLIPGRIQHFKRLVDELSGGNGHPELFSLLERHLRSLVKVAKDDFPMSRLLRTMLPRNSFELFTRTRKLPRQSSRVERRLAMLISDRGPAARVASEILRALMTSPEIAKSMVHNRPYLGIEFLGFDIPEIHDFCDIYFGAILETSGSIWYSELKNNQNLDSSQRYYLPPENRLLNFLLADAKVAHSLTVYRPVGNFMLKELDRRVRLGTADEYNWAMDDFNEEGKWKSPLWTGIFFFDVMVSSALWQDITWHMWLYYYPLLVKKIVRNYNPQDVLVDESSEWPTKYSFLIYEIVRNLCSWIREVQHLPNNHENVRLRSTEPEYENENIPKSAILALGQSCRHIVLSNNVAAPFKSDILQMTFNLFLELRCKNESVPFSIALAKSLRQGGGLASKQDAPLLREEIRLAFMNFDKIPHRQEDLDSFVELIGIDRR